MGRGAGDQDTGTLGGCKSLDGQDGADDREQEIVAAVREIERAYGAQTLLYSLIEKIGGEVDVDRICRVAVQEMEDALGASTLLLMLLDEPTGALSVKAASGVCADRAEGFRLRPDACVIGRALRSLRPIAARCGEGVERLPFPADYLLSVPMVVRGRTIGAILACDKKAGGEFLTPEIKLACALAAYVGAALSNAFLIAHKEAQAAALSKSDRLLRQSYENLLQADKMATLGLIVGTALHDVNNFLTTISGHVQLLEMSDPDPHRRASYRNVLRATDGIRGLIQGIQGFSRKSAEAYALLDVRRPLEEAISLIEKFLTVNRIRLIRAFRTGLPPIMGSLNQLEQVFLNLIQNAAHAMGMGGALTLSADAEGGDVVLTVADTGCGIPEEHIGQVFDVFFTTKPAGKGTGLGLSICKRIVEEHGGSVGVESEVGVGTRFTIRLPGVRNVSDFNGVSRAVYPDVKTFQSPVSFL
ncbi:MAG: hypothetical protein A3F84_05715 [Candidatus Handelsmanbacteria bacterium RIFCSPLOWO2_12_FULL_64_10]|uniref:histidine kinase n=1 Tax=Handelsmanbacteria sp. (strain RIFCSPLOWO2_12_FULL_64_10) TaxID=1817868 RepID=A0A1F6C733_HANXR|nr:MAG: hypothetical protein A3F84_05715 [Candidatus Handelsmanbacteria bacterium RIFCSPLOWO2_12_FULL_64_10]